MVKAIMHGCNGHMGRVITDIIKNTEGIELVAGVDKYTKVPNDYPVFESIGACDVEADVIIDLPKLKTLSTLWFIAMAAVAGVVFHMVD